MDKAVLLALIATWESKCKCDKPTSAEDRYGDGLRLGYKNAAKDLTTLLMVLEKEV